MGGGELTKSQRTRRDQQHRDPRPRVAPGLWGLGCRARWLRMPRGRTVLWWILPGAETAS